MRRVVVTGTGVVTPLGNDTSTLWNALLKGESGISKVSRFDIEEFTSKIAGEVKNFKIEDVMNRKEARRTDLYTQYAYKAANEAMQQAGFGEDWLDDDRFGVLIGSGIGGIQTFEDQTRTYIEKGPGKVSPFFITMMIADIAAGRLAIEYGLKGPNFATTSACASSGHAIGTAFNIIRYGMADRMLAGGAEAPIVPISFAGFCSNRALSTRNDEPEKASRPFDVDRDGFVMGEGAGCLVLEELESAINRGANILAEIVGFGATADAFHITAPPEDGEGAYRVMEQAMKDAGIDIEQVDYINTHGTSTPAGDVAEAAAIARLFDGRLDSLKVNSTKSMIGHLLGGAAAVEAIVTIESIRSSRVHPTLNVENKDPSAKDIDLVTEGAQDHKIRYALNNSFGFGGHNSSIVLKAFEQ